MMAEEARTALASIWVVMVALAETGHDLAVDRQRNADAEGAAAIGQHASDLAALSRAAEVLARQSHQP